MSINVMKRYEMKYLLNAEQTAFLREKLKGHMEPDEYGRSTIASLYYDTPDRRLIRASLEKPMFKEKLRLRSYGPADGTKPVYLELKRKAYGIVYKRRIETSLPDVDRFFAGEGNICACGQIDRELAAFRDHYQTLYPSSLIVYFCHQSLYISAVCLFLNQKFFTDLLPDRFLRFYDLPITRFPR